MKKKDLAELRTKSKEELKKTLKEAEVSLLKLRMDLGAGKTKNVRAISRKKDEIARIKTIMREKEITEEK